MTNGGRVLDVTAVAPTFEAARAQAYAACELIEFDGKTCRTDIGLKATKTRADMVQMPSGVPVACVAIGGAKNAAIYATQILGATIPEYRARIVALKQEMAED